MIDTLIFGALSGLMLVLIVYGFNKLQFNIKKNMIESRIERGTVEIIDLRTILTYYSDTESVREEGIKYVNLAETHFPEDQGVNESIFYYFIKSQNFQKAMEKIDFLNDMLPNNPDMLFLKGYCFYQLNEKEKAEEFRQKAISIDSSFKEKEFTK